MAGSRRGRGLGGLGGGEIRGTLGTLLRTTLAQVGTVRDALERGAREGRARLDDARLGRRHEEALAALGAIVLDLVRQGELADLEEIREVAEAIAHVEEVEARQEEAHPPRPRKAVPAVTRGRARRPDADDAHVEHEEHDGTVSSRSWTPPRPASPPRVWRPNVPADDVTRDLRLRRTHIDEEEPGAQFREDRRPRGGISFERVPDGGPDPDDDLAEYMHPDDVPPKDKK